MLSLINKGRIERGINLALYTDQKLQEMAQAHSEHMVQYNVYSHYTRDGLSPIDRAEKANFTYTVR